MSKLSSNWNNEAYVSLHLVQKMLELAALPPRSGYSHWIPEFKVRVPKLTVNNQVVETEKEGYAKLIKDNRSYSSLEDLQKKLGAKRPLSWLRAYKQVKS